MKIRSSPEKSHGRLGSNRVRLKKIVIPSRRAIKAEKRPESNLLQTIIEEHLLKFGFSKTYDEFVKESTKKVDPPTQQDNKKIPFSYLYEKMQNCFKNGDSKAFFTAWTQLRKRSQIYAMDTDKDKSLTETDRLEFL